ncbi:TRAP transporter substrate-binding protein [Pseudorhodoplanes sp.]|uniref:TRAP transporter substrate-binding protein n=1 Tax=Pseudorhodoplanes sp. TaxID=1934341 RepID=UPI002C60323B|nr:TRAP transporter substrate-binding protein [Pseudorhodoplanes sp.]HWV40979.1 TRAP transporter substrate-binding protein [Pseudorhodoplanes sp.]
MSRLAKVTATGSAAFALAAFVGFSPAAQAQTTTLTMSSWVSPQHLLTKDVLAVWGQQVEKATNGRVKMQMLAKHPSAAPGTFDAVRDGLVDVSYVTASYTPARHVLPLLPELPGGGATAEINSVAFSRIHWKYFQPVNEYKGVKLLGVWTHGPGQMFNTKRPINRVEDLAGMKIRSGGGISEQMARALGASPFVKPAPESYELLSSGVADGTFFPLESIISFKLDTVVKHATLFPGGFYGSAFGFFMNEDKWNKLSKQDQDAIMSVSGEAIARLAGRAWDNTDRQAMEVMKKANIDIQPASPELIKGVQERSKAIVDKWKKDATAKGVDGEKVYAEFHEELKRVAAGQ